MTRYEHTRKNGKFASLTPAGLCVYCGRLTRRRVRSVAVCACHSDLPELDPLYAIPDQWKATQL